MTHKWENKTILHTLTNRVYSN